MQKKQFYDNLIMRKCSFIIYKSMQEDPYFYFANVQLLIVRNIFLYLFKNIILTTVYIIYMTKIIQQTSTIRNL